MKKKVEQIQHRKWEVIYEDDYTISIWKYDTKKNSANNPYEVEVKYKKANEYYLKGYELV